MIRAAAAAWVRGAVRRPGRGAVAVATLGLMMAAIVAAVVAADSLDQLFVEDARAEWGTVDVEVTSATAATFSESTARLLSGQAAANAPRAAPRVLLPAVVQLDDRRETGAQLLGLGAEEQAYPDLEVIDGRGDIVSLLALAPDETVINARLAQRLGAGVGDAVSVVAAVPLVRREVLGSDQPDVIEPHAESLRLVVAGIVADTGVADLHRRPALLLRREVAQRVAGVEGEVTHLHLTAAGQGREAAEDVVQGLEPALREFGLIANEVKADALDVAEDEGGQFRGILLTLALLAMGAAAVASANLLTATGHERGWELAMLRVGGITDGQARVLVAAEAVSYASAAIVLGAVIGIPIANVIASQLAQRFAQLGAGRGREQVELALTVDPVTIVVAAAVVVVAAAWSGWSAGRALVAAPLDEVLRGTPTAQSRSTLGAARPVVALVLGAGCLGMGLTADLGGDALRYLGLTLIGVAGWLWARRRVANRAVVDQWAAAGALVWAVAGAAVLADFSQGYETGFGILTVAAVIAVAAGTVLAVPHLRPVARAVGALFGRHTASVRVAAANAEAVPRRTASTMAVVGIVLFMIAALHVLGNATAVDTARQGGGFDVMATSIAPVDPAAFAALDQAEHVVALPNATVPETAYRAEEPNADGATYDVRYPIRVLPVSDELLATQEFGLAESSDYETAAEALTAVRADRNKIVVDRYARPEGSAIGDEIVLDVGSGERRYELVAVLDTFLLSAALVAPEELPSIAPSAGPTLVLASATSSATPQQLADVMNAVDPHLGVDARPLTEVAADLAAVNRTFTDVFALMIVLGLAVTLCAEGALVVRAGRERRAELAVTHALGMRRRGITMTLMLERLLPAVLGGLMGAVAGVGVLRVLFALGFSDLAFVIDWVRLAVVAAGVVVVLAVLTWVAALGAARQDPATALRDLG